ncbi:MAG TPA: CHAT domain-containing protein, partial [Vicinamibacteria bacterium]
DTLLAMINLDRARRDPQAGLQRSLEAIDLARQAGARIHEARGFQYLGAVYNDLGDYRAALRTYASQASLWEEEGLYQAQAQSLSNLGRLHWRLGEAEQALASHRRAEEVAQREARAGGAAAAWTAGRLADAWTDLGLTYRLLAEAAPAAGKGEKYEASLRYLKEALAEHERLGNVAGQRVALRGLRRTHESRGEWDLARSCSARILDMPEGADVPEFTALARMALHQGDLEQARDWVEEALAAAEAARPRVSDYDLQATYEGSLSSLFDLHVEVLMRQHARAPGAGLDWAAFQASERGRARALIDNVASAPGRPAAAAAGGGKDQGPQADGRAEELRARIAEQPEGSAERMRLESELRRLLSEMETRRQRGLRQEALKRVVPPTLAEIQALLDAESLLLEYDLGPEHSYLFAVGKTSWASYVLPAEAPLADLARKLPEHVGERIGADGATADEVRRARREADRRFQRDASVLSEAIFGAVRPGPAVKRLILVWDGALHYVPAPGLPLPRAWRAGAAAGPRPALASVYEVVTLPSATLVAALDASRAERRRPGKRLAVFADPVFDARDPRLSSSAAPPPRPGGLEGTGLGAGPVRPATMGRGLARLPHTAELASAVLKGVPEGEGLIALGFAANREAALDPQLADFGTVVFATHAYFDQDFPALSGIVLSQVNEDGRPRPGVLRQHDVYGMSLNADLVVLAGCETGVGREMRGEGLLGLSRAFFYAGTSRVVASLWQVEEGSTMKLVTDFLRRTGKGEPYAAALRHAQLTVAADPRYRAPYYWAGFVLQGDWR